MRFSSLPTHTDTLTLDALAEPIAPAIEAAYRYWQALTAPK